MGISRPVRALWSATSVIGSVTRYMCSMASTGSSMPIMRPTSRAHSPPALTMCSAWISPRSVTTSQVPSARWRRSVTIVWRSTSAPALRAHMA